MADYECPFKVGDIITLHEAKTDIILSELVMNQMNVRGNLWING